jgi:predicted dehydrogenase
VGQPHGIAIVGLGVISGAYLETIGRHPALRIVAVADLDTARAEAVAEQTGALALPVAEAIAHPEVETVLNLTIPAAHAEIALAAIAAGKKVYGEKPLAATLDEALAVMAAASAGQVGSAPDTVLGTGTQTARAVIENGAIGRPISATASWFSAGHERWHPNPDFYYQPGGGPLLDMGPYYLTSLVHLLGPVRSVIGAASRQRDSRTIGSGPRAGSVIPVAVDTHVTGVLEHLDGALSTVTMSFDGVRTGANPIEVHGETGSLIVPDPNTFDGDVRHFALGADDWKTIAPSAGYADGSRGVGLLDFAAGQARASGELGLHVLEVMSLVLAAASTGQRQQVASRPSVPPIVPLTSRAVWGSA